MTASWATEEAGALAKVRNFSVTLNGPIWKNLIVMVSPDEFDHTVSTSMQRLKNLFFRNPFKIKG